MGQKTDKNVNDKIKVKKLMGKNKYFLYTIVTFLLIDYLEKKDYKIFE